MTKKEVPKIEIRSDDVQEILGHVPRWIIRWGITLIFIVLIVVLIGSWFFKYPDVVNAPIIISTENPPSPLVARTSGKIDRLFTKNQETVNQGNILAMIENTARYEDMMRLKEELVEFRFFLTDYDTSQWISFPSYTLGEVQQVYASFLKNYNDYRNYIRLDFYSQKIQSVQRQIQSQQQYIRRLETQRKLLRNELRLMEKQFSRDSTLFRQQVISEAEFEKSQSLLINKTYEYEQTGVTIAATQIELNRLEQQIPDLKLTQQETREKTETSLIEAFENLVAQLDLWEQNYLLIAPVNGTVTFTTYWGENQAVQAGDQVMTIVPDSSGDTIGKIALNMQRSGKVKQGQVVNIKFEGFPYMEFGMVQGKIKSKSLVPSENTYTLEVDLPNGLTTFYGEELTFSQGMTGQAEIVTEDMRLLQHIFDPIKYIIKKNKRNGKGSSVNGE